MKKISKIKRKIAVFLIFLLSINSFGAIVSDNDGSAFVTKAEFDALKASFNKQIDDYNASIDGKIDGAIASYLAGVKTKIWANESVDTYAIQYPLKIFGKSPYLTTNTDTAPYFGRNWTPSYCIYQDIIIGSFKNYEAFTYDSLSQDYNVIKNFYNGEKIGSGSSAYFKIKEQLNNFNAKYTYFMHPVTHGARADRANTNLFTYAMFMGAIDDSDGTEVTTTGCWHYDDTGTKKYDTSTLITDMVASKYQKWVDGSGTTKPSPADPTFAWDTTNRRWNKTNEDTFAYKQIENPCVDPQWDVNYTNSKITEIVGNPADTNWAPVAYNGVVKFTNVAEAARRNIAPTPSDKSMKIDPWRGSMTQYFRLVLLAIPDWGLLDYDSAKAKNSSTVLADKWDTSLLKASDLRYDIKDTVTGTITEQTMTNGIYLFTANKNYDVKCTIKATFPSGAASIFFSKQPITWSVPTSANNLLIDDGRKYKQLTSGVATEINFKVNADDKIYYKIYCPASDVIFEEPTLMTMVSE